MRTVAITNQKGGVGKTTTAHHLGIALAKRDQRVLVVDMDPQTHLTIAARTQATRGSVYDVLRGAKTIESVIVASPHQMDVLPSEQLLARFEAEAQTDPGWMTILRNALDDVATSYDWCLIDTPPSLGALSTNALVACDAGVLVPMVPEPLPLKGLQLLLRTVSELRSVNPSLTVRGIVPTMVHPRWATHRSVGDVLPHLLPDIPVLDGVPAHGSFVRASAIRESIFYIAPNSSGAIAYRRIADDLMGVTTSARVGAVA